MADSMLMTNTPQGRYPYAGHPLVFDHVRPRRIDYRAVHTRPAHRAGRGGSPRFAKTDDPASDAQPGVCMKCAKARWRPCANLFTTMAASMPPLFVMPPASMPNDGDDATIRELWPAIEAALAWIDGAGDPDGDGFIEYYRATEQGLANQGWKDSHDAIFHADGRLAQGPIALAEVQGYVYFAKVLAARCARRLGWSDRARRLEAGADLLAQRFDAAFWCPEIETYALALDGDKEPCRVRSPMQARSCSGIAKRNGPSRWRRACCGRNSFPDGHSHDCEHRGSLQSMSCHNGSSIWPHDNALIARHVTPWAEAAGRGCSRACSKPRPIWRCGGCRELFCGFRAAQPRTGLYLVASPQAWASATPFTPSRRRSGCNSARPGSEIRLIDPRLPSFLDWVVLRDCS